MKKKLSIILMAVLLVAMTLAGCKSDEKSNASNGDKSKAPENFNETGYPIVNEAITLEMMGQRSPLQPDWGEMGFFKTMKEKTNMDFTYRVSTSEQYQQQKQLAFASQQLPDLFFGALFNAAEEVDYGSQGFLQPLENLIEKYAPNLQKVMEKYPNLKPSITAPDGHIYALPGIDTSITSQTPIAWMNGPWLEKIGAERPTTTEELYNLLKKFKETDMNGNGKDDEIPMTASSIAELRYNILPAFGIPYGTSGSLPGIYEDNGTVKYAFMQDGYKEYMKFLNRLYSEKLLDQQIVSHTWEQYVAKGAANQIGVFPTWPIIMMGYADPAEGENYPLLPALTSPINNKPITVKITEIKRGRAAITSANKHPEATMRWLDYMYSEEGTILARLGIEGKNWEWTDDSKSSWTLLAPEGMNTTQANAQDAPGAGTAVPMILEQEFFSKEENPTLRIIEQWILDEYYPHLTVPFPDVYFTLEEQETTNTLRPDIDKYIEQMEAKFVTGELSIDKEWDKYVSTLNKLGIEDIVKVNQAAYDRWAEAK
ncbi:extracellular solute-binding protein [Bacillus kwashiorkori]|uniref:extracellular solute-binding protein n=1 Tax=Bacillus kwashiorkori TaxID=1522318 RepID=UPI000782588C|nr:extracellular solute-binding protein [Bacillus kwashiorkori]